MSVIRVLDPVQRPVVTEQVAAPRLPSLGARTVGLYANDKLNSRELLDLIGDALVDRFGVGETVHGRYSASSEMPREAWVDVEECDFVVLAVGD